MTVEKFYNQEMNDKPALESCFVGTVGITYSSGEVEQDQIHSVDEMLAFAEAYHQSKLKSNVIPDVSGSALIEWLENQRRIAIELKAPSEQGEMLYDIIEKVKGMQKQYYNKIVEC